MEKMVPLLDHVYYVYHSSLTKNNICLLSIANPQTQTDCHGYCRIHVNRVGSLLKSHTKDHVYRRI